jgi:hypothetical protein
MTLSVAAASPGALDEGRCPPMAADVRRRRPPAVAGMAPVPLGRRRGFRRVDSQRILLGGTQPEAEGVNRRRSERVTKRVEVQFWQPGWQVAVAGQVGPKVLRGYSTNVSASGMHIATATPLPAQSRLRIEVLYGERGFVIEGVVAHRRAVHPELVKVTPPGMGVRFLSPEELVHELFPREARGDGQAAEASRDPEIESRTFSVRFASAKEFLGVFQRDILNGGLFVATSRPARMREAVRLEIYPPAPPGPPGPPAPPIQVGARVVQRFLPPAGGSALQGGMGVELLDSKDALEHLQRIADRLSSLAG